MSWPFIHDSYWINSNHRLFVCHEFVLFYIHYIATISFHCVSFFKKKTVYTIWETSFWSSSNQIPFDSTPMAVRNFDTNFYLWIFKLIIIMIDKKCILQRIQSFILLISYNLLFFLKLLVSYSSFFKHEKIL